MSQEQRQYLDASYDTLEYMYTELMDRFKTSPDSATGDLRLMYGRMQQMHNQMENNHNQMMGMNMGRRHMQGQGDRMMSEGMGMRMRGHMTGEWYRQMMSMHDQMAVIHERHNQKNMAEMNRRLSGMYGKMMRRVPGLDEPTEETIDENQDPATLNGESLYSQNCASCHGTNANGMAGVFPPLIDTEWITADDKSIPVRILLHGINGEIEVRDQKYQGVMPSFKARLSAAEIAAILNYLRSESEGTFPEISQEEVTQIDQTYRNRTSPWSAEELSAE